MACVYLCNKPTCSAHVSQNLKYILKKGTSKSMPSESESCFTETRKVPKSTESQFLFLYGVVDNTDLTGLL